MHIDLSKLAPVKANTRKPKSFDLQYREKYGKWRVAEEIFARLDLNNNGFNLMLHADGIVVLQLVPEADAQLLRRRGNSTAKGTEFTSGSLRTLLNHRHPGVNDFQLTAVGERDGLRYFAVEAFVGTPAQQDVPMDVQVTTSVETIVDEDDAETTEMVAAVAEEAATAEVSEEVAEIVPLQDQEEVVEAAEATNYDFEDSGDGEATAATTGDLGLDEIPAPVEEAPVKKAVKNPFTTF